VVAFHDGEDGVSVSDFGTQGTQMEYIRGIFSLAEGEGGQESQIRPNHSTSSVWSGSSVSNRSNEPLH
jgi:hypothetical protein